MARMQGAGMPGVQRYIVPTVKLDTSQVRDLRGQNMSSIKAYIDSKLKAANLPKRRVRPTKVQLRAQYAVMKPYRKFHFQSLKIRGGK